MPRTSARMARPWHGLRRFSYRSAAAIGKLGATSGCASMRRPTSSSRVRIAGPSSRCRSIRSRLPSALLVVPLLGRCTLGSGRVVCCLLYFGVELQAQPRSHTDTTRIEPGFEKMSRLVSSAPPQAACLRFSSRSGSYSSPVIQSRCSSTASLRATAMMARLRANLPPRSINRIPNRLRSESSPKGPRM